MSATDKPARILVVDDAPDTLEVVRRHLVARGHAVTTAPGVSVALELLEETPFDLVVTDLKMPGQSGLDLVRHIRENLPDTEVMMITGYASIQGAVDALRQGAEDYLAKPFTEAELLSAVGGALDKLRARRPDRAPRLPRPPHGLVGHSPCLQQALALVGRAAASTATVLLTGESGTGKELLARAIHYGGPRASAPFVPVNCGGIPEPLLESALFGHVKGTFTGAHESRAGFFQTADGGTLFLDEVGETSLAMQVKLLRVLQDGEVAMLGATRTQHVDVRVIAATHQDLQALVRQGRFREDFYFRLNVVPIPVPPLRVRGEDILLLAMHFAEKYAAEAGRAVPVFTDRAARALLAHGWPGNVRELENLVHRLLVLTEGDRIDITDLPEGLRFTLQRETDWNRPLREVEASHIQGVLARVGGNRTRAAEVLGIDRKTLREKLKRTGLEPDGM